MRRYEWVEHGRDQLDRDQFRKKLTWLSGAAALGTAALSSTPDTSPEQNKRPSQDNLRGSAKKQDTSKKSFTMDTNMIEDEPAQVSLMATSSGTSSSNGNQETPITRHPPTFGFPETMTTVVPYVTYFSVTPGATGLGTNVTIGVNSLYDIMAGHTVTAATASTACAAGNIYNCIIPRASTPAFGTSLFQFPSAISAGTSTLEAGQWRGVWDKLYDYYTVLGAEVDISVENCVSGANNADILLAWGYDSTGVNNGNTFPTNTQQSEMEHWPGVKWKLVPWAANNDSAMSAKLTLRYKANQVKRDVRNDEDVKTWTAVGSVPTYRERLRLYFFEGPFNTVACSAANVKITIRHIVQYKDLKVNLRYPSSNSAAQTAFAVNFATDIFNIAG